MMQNKIAIGLGLMLAFTAEVSLADGKLLTTPTEEIKPAGAPIYLDTSVLSSSDSSHYTYYDITCTVINKHEEEGVLMLSHINSNVYSNMGPVLFNGDERYPVGGHVEGIIKPGVNTVVFKRFVIEGDASGSNIEVSAKEAFDELTVREKRQIANPNPFGVFGFYLDHCDYAVAKENPSNSTLQPAVQVSSENTIPSTK